jgi:hypothetical protein
MDVAGRRSRGRVGIGLLCLAAGSVCTMPAPAAATHLTRVFDEFKGTYRNVGLGSSTARVRRTFGKPHAYSPGQPFVPLGDDWYDIGGPTYIPAPPKSGRYDLEKGFMRYRRISLQAFRGRIFDLIVTSPRARTTRGVRVGDQLRAAKDAYPGLHCGVANEGTEYVQYPYCSGRLAPKVYVWFGQDPIRSVSFGTQSFEYSGP